MIRAPSKAPGGGGSNESSFWFWRHRCPDVGRCPVELALRRRCFRRECSEWTSVQPGSCLDGGRGRCQTSPSTITHSVKQAAASFPADSHAEAGKPFVDDPGDECR